MMLISFPQIIFGPLIKNLMTSPMKKNSNSKILLNYFLKNINNCSKNSIAYLISEK